MYEESWNEAINSAGYREKYAISQYLDANGNVIIEDDARGHKLWIFTYSDDNPYQDANGATYDATEGRWVG